MSEIKIGDKVLVELEVKNIVANGVLASTNNKGYQTFVASHDILQHFPAIKIGDTVYIKLTKIYKYKVLSINSDYAWIKETPESDGLSFSTHKLSELELV